MANEGLYIHKNGEFKLQNNGVCKKQGNSSECEIYRHTGSSWQKIYPREQSFNVSTDDFGGFSMCTTDQLYTNKKNGKAYQGWTSGVEGNPGQRFGQMWWNNGKPNPPGKLVRVDRVEFSITRNINTGWHRAVTGTLCLSNTRGTGSFSDLVSYANSHTKVKIPIPTVGVRGTVTSDDVPALKNFFYEFLTTDSAKSIALYNGESSKGSGGWSAGGQSGSANYCGTSNVYIKLGLVYNA